MGPSHMPMMQAIKTLLRHLEMQIYDHQPGLLLLWISEHLLYNYWLPLQTSCEVVYHQRHTFKVKLYVQLDRAKCQQVIREVSEKYWT